MPHDLVLWPRDGWFVKDGRGWYTHGATIAHGHPWPPPSTVHGALIGGYGRQLEAAGGKVLSRDEWLACRQLALGPTVALRQPVGVAPTTDHRLWPAPQDAVYFERQVAGRPQSSDDKPKDFVVRWLGPQPPTVPTLGTDPDDEVREALWRPVLDDQRKSATGPRWWTEADFIDWLLAPDKPARPVRSQDRKTWPDPVTHQETHVRIDAATGAAKDGILFSHDLIEATGLDKAGRAWQWGLACRTELPPGGGPDSLDGDWLTLGGKGRLTRCVAPGTDLFAPPEELMKQLVGERRFRLVVVAPADFARGWLPDGLAAVGDEYRGDLGVLHGAEIILRAAYVDRPWHVAGWDIVRNHSKKTRRLVAPGAVYFVELADGATLTRAQAEALWMAGVGAGTGEGYGRVVPGVWPAEGA